jgi:predicted acyltransferase
MATVSVEKPAAVGTQRMLSLDVLRGVTIAFMILVNNNGWHAYWPFEHSDWNGWTPTDIVFPTFLFLVGVTIVISLESRFAKGATAVEVLPKILRRAVLLFGIGIFLALFPFFHWSQLRVYGVLQRIAACYLVGSLVYLLVRRMKRPAVALVALLVVLLVGYYVLMRWVPVPGYGMPGRDVPFLDKDRNIVAVLDRHLHWGRLWEKTRDPEGLLSTFPAIGTTLLGILTALWLRTQRTLQNKCAGLLGGGVVLLVLGELCNPWFPINKKLWTSSFVLLMAGWSLVLWALLMWVTEIKGWKRWTGFWLVFGMNAIASYAMSDLLAAPLWAISMGPHETFGYWLYLHSFAYVHPPGVASLLYSVWFVLMCWLPMAVLYRMKIFLKV